MWMLCWCCWSKTGEGGIKADPWTKIFRHSPVWGWFIYPQPVGGELNLPTRPWQIEHCSYAVWPFTLHPSVSLVFCCRGMSDSALTVICKTFVLAKILHAITAWWGFTAASNRHGIQVFVPHGVHLGFYGRDDLSITQLVTRDGWDYFLLLCTMINRLPMCSRFMTSSQISPRGMVSDCYPKWTL